jgi:thiamine-phosphate pyrophosphorylase
MAEPPFSSNDSSRIAQLRILDAAANRAGEGLRVVEDYARFVLDDRHLTQLLKSLRHDLTETLARLAPRERHGARETQADVGTSVSTTSERARDSLWEVVAASFKRTEQALRSLEEYGKLSSPSMADDLQQLRYRLYTLERAVDITRTARERLAGVRLYVLVDGGRSPEVFTELVEQLIEAGAGVIQLRDKSLADRELLNRARRLRRLTAGSETLFIMNDRPDIARLSRADGVHVGQEELTVKDVRAIVGPEPLVGLSTHSIEQARAAALEGADYIGVGPTFPSTTKAFTTYAGLGLARQVAAEITLPAFAIGGVSPENVGQIRAAGLERVVVGAAITAAADPGAAVREMLQALKG